MALRGSCNANFPGKIIWCSKALRWVPIFVWILAWEKILTSDNLIKQGINLIAWGCMCMCKIKTWIICSCTVILHVHCEPLPSLCLRFNGYCWGMVLIFYLVGDYGLAWRERSHWTFKGVEALVMWLNTFFTRSLLKWPHVLSPIHFIVDCINSLSFQVWFIFCVILQATLCTLIVLHAIVSLHR